MAVFTEALADGGDDASLAVRVTDLEARVAALEAASTPTGDPKTHAPPPAAAAQELPPVGALLTSSAIARATGSNPSGWSAWAANHATGSVRQYAGGAFRLTVRSDRGRRRVSWERLD